MWERIFRLESNKTTLRQEVIGGATTFMTIAYIIFVQPVVMSQAGMDMGAALVATCLASAAATLAMGLLANYPIALAPAMGHNFFFSFVVVSMGYSWQQALGAVFVSGILFLLFATVGFRERLIQLIPESLKIAIAVGIGLLIAGVGLQWSGIVVDHPGTLVGLGDLSSSSVLLSLLGLAVMSILLSRGFRTAILVGILVNTTVGLACGMMEYQGVVGPVPSLGPSWLQLDLAGVLESGLLSVIFVFFFLDLFDTVGTLVGVSREAGFLAPDGSLPRARPAFLADALGTTLGALLGTSTVTSYVESATGISAGARTGLANVVTASLFLCTLYLSPLVRMIGGGVESGDGRVHYPVVAPALILVGCWMLRSVKDIRWQEFSEAIPAFLTIVMMPLTFSITEGISFGFISYVLLKLGQGRPGEVPPLLWVLALLFLVRYVFLMG